VNELRARRDRYAAHAKAFVDAAQPLLAPRG
jgi:hypothetical protein